MIRSNFSPEFNPMEEYLKSLPKWDGKTDYIAELAHRVTVMQTGGYRHTEEDFAYAFKKWLVNMVVCWVRPDVTNQSIMVFVGKGGIFKTTFFRPSSAAPSAQVFRQRFYGRLQEQGFPADVCQQGDSVSR